MAKWVCKQEPMLSHLSTLKKKETNKEKNKSIFTMIVEIMSREWGTKAGKLQNQSGTFALRGKVSHSTQDLCKGGFDLKSHKNKCIFKKIILAVKWSVKMKQINQGRNDGSLIVHKMKTSEWTQCWLPKNRTDIRAEGRMSRPHESVSATRWHLLRGGRGQEEK